MKSQRPSYDEYFMKMAYLAASRSTCIRRHVGAVLVKDKHVLSTGYNGAPKGMKHCEEAGCLREKLQTPSGERHEICRGLHAEQNAIIQAAVFGISIKNSILYVTNTPCIVCAKMLINAGVTEIIYAGDYPDALSIEMLRESKIKLKHYQINDIQYQKIHDVSTNFEKIRKI
jgi:dCMP deaminase